MHRTPSRQDLDTCYEIGRQAKALYPHLTWLEVEPLARKVWDLRASALDWSQAAPIVRMNYHASVPWSGPEGREVDAAG